MAATNLDTGSFASFALRALRLVLTIASVIVLAILVARGFWLVTAGADPLVPAPTGQLSLVSRSTGPAIDTAVLLRETPFKQAVATTEEEFVDLTDVAPETELELICSGTRMAGDDSGVAYVATVGSSQKLYRVQDAIDGLRGVSVDRINKNSVILSRNGSRERLPCGVTERVILSPEEAAKKGTLRRQVVRSLDTPSTGTAGSSTPTSASKQAIPDLDTPAISSRSSAPARPIAAAPRSGVRPALVRMTRDELMSLPRWARFDVKTANGEPGVTVFPINAAMFRKSGLRARDIVQTIGGVKLGQGADAELARLLSDIEEEDTVVIELLRDGQPIELRVRLSGG